MTRRFALLFVMIASVVSLVRAAEFQDDLHERRARFMDRLGSDSMLILWSAPVRPYARDVDYDFRQDGNFYYLTGINQPESILVLMPGNRDRKEILFISPRDPVREHWDGRLLSADDARNASGIAAIYLTTDFQPFLDAVLGQNAFIQGGGTERDVDAFFGALRKNNAQIAVVGPPPAAGGKTPESYDFVAKLRSRFSGFQMRDVTRIFEELRQVKTNYERKLLAQGGRIAAEAHKSGMKAARPQAYEYEVNAAIEYAYKKNGGEDWGNPAIVASGPNATILHYEKYERRMEDGDLLLIDSTGRASYKYLTVDITRTIPVNGKFTQAQRDIYEIVLRAQEEGIKVAKPGAHLRDIHQKTVEVVTDGLLRLGLITDKRANQYQTWYTHGSSHWIGLEVHDVGDDNKPLADGMAFTIEPGIYIRPENLETLPKTPENDAFIEKVRPAIEKYKNIGVRIEDSFVLNNGKLEMLTSNAPRSIEGIERFMRSQ